MAAMREHTHCGRFFVTIPVIRANLLVHDKAFALFCPFCFNSDRKQVLDKARHVSCLKQSRARCVSAMFLAGGSCTIRNGGTSTGTYLRFSDRKVI